MHDQGIKVPLRLGGACFVVCPLLLVIAAAPVGEQWQLAAGGAALVLFAIGLTGVRQRATGVGLPILLAVVAVVGVVAEVLGALLQISGVVIAVPLVAAVVFITITSQWRPGDLSLICLALGTGFAIAYVLDNLVSDDNGSQTDQAVPLLVGPGIALAVWVLARARFLSPVARICVVLGAALGLAALVVALWTRDSTFVLLAVPACLLFGAGLVAAGIRLSAARPN